MIDCVLLSLNIANRHRSIMPDNTFNEDTQQIKIDILTENLSASYAVVRVSSNSVGLFAELIATDLIIIIVIGESKLKSARN